MLEVMPMATFRHEVRINAPANVVWSIVTIPTSIPDWFPGIIGADVEGSLRTIHLASGISMPEEILCNDATQRRFMYRITAPLYKFHLASIDVIEIGVNDSLCVYSTTAEPDTLALLIAGGTIGALKEIKRQAEQKVKTHG
jgi:Polyketide cyclase / dehydrase and lipid transport